MSESRSIGIVGGSGQLGGAIARGLLDAEFVLPEQLWISSRSDNGSACERLANVRHTTDNRELARACQVVIVAVPPRSFSTLDLQAEDRLVISVMAGVSIERIAQHTSASRVVRAMSNPAAEWRLAYSPWCACAALNDDDREWTRRFFEAFGITDEVGDEEQISRFTALTGPVPGFVAYYADCMVNHAVNGGIDPTVADRAVRQLFHASAVVLSESDISPGEHVQKMIDYAGTTAAGLQVMKDSPLATSIEQGLEAAYQKTRDLG